MPARRTISAAFTDSRPLDATEATGVVLGFRPKQARFETDHIETEAVLGPDASVAAIEGLGKVVRILRAARIAVPSDPMDWLGQESLVLERLDRAIGTPLMLGLRPRTRVRFTAWLEDRIQVIDDVADVVESPDAYYVHRQSGRFPVRISRKSVIRHRTESLRWFEILSIDRAPRSEKSGPLLP